VRRWADGLQMLRRLCAGARVWRLSLLMLGAGLTEGISVLLLLPLLELLQLSPGAASGAAGASSPAWVARLAAVLARAHVPLTPGLLLSMFVSLVALAGWLQYARLVEGAKLQQQAVDQLRGRAFGALVEARYAWLVRQPMAELGSLLLGDVARVGVGLNAGLSLITGLFTLLAYLAAALVISPLLSLAAVLLAGVAWALMAGQRRESLRIGESTGLASRALAAQLSDALQGVKLAKLQGAEHALQRQFNAATEALRDQQIAFQRSQGRARWFTQVGAALMLSMFILGGLAWLHVPLSQLLVLTLLLARMVPMFSALQQQAHQWLNAWPALQDVDRLLAASQAMAEPAADTGTATGTGTNSAPTAERQPLRESLRLEGVTVRHAGRDAPALQGVDLCLWPHTTTAVIGPSGAGKTTLADVLAGLVEPDAGTLRLDGQPLAGARLRQWRQGVAYVTQESFLVHDSVRRNLLWGLPDPVAAAVDDAALERVLALAAADFVARLPQGLDTVIGDRGMMISGGERQRLTLARALLRDPALLILDEATSALDVESEARIGQALQALHGRVTVLLIGHRLATLEHADQVLVMNQGRAAFCGTWAEWQAQSSSAAPC